MIPLPHVSVLIPTFARSWLLAEQLESFARQTYQGPMSCVVLNDCVSQGLICGARNVTIHNMGYRCASLLIKRKILLTLAPSSIVQFWDDDDIALPDRVSNGVEQLEADEPVSRGYHEWRLSRGGVLNRAPAAAFHTLTMRVPRLRKLFIEDAPQRDSDICALMVQNLWFHKPKHHTPQHAPDYIYRCPLTESLVDTPAGYLTAASDAKLRLDSNEEPHGTVIVTPGWNQDYVALTKNMDKVSL